MLCPSTALDAGARTSTARRVPSKVQLLGRVGVFHGGNPNLENFSDEWGVGVDNAC